MQMRRCLSVHAAIATALAVSVPAVTSAQTAPLSQHEVPVALASGPIVNQGNHDRVLWADMVHVPDASWLRLKFTEATLGITEDATSRSYLRLTSMADGAVQYLDAISIEQWYHTSAYFNGDAVAIELIGGPGLRNEISISQVIAGEPMTGIESICGDMDDRILSSDPRSARALPVGCTAWTFNDLHHAMISAGHCSDANGIDVVEFNVPLSNGDHSINHPGPEDQYSVDRASVQDQYGLFNGRDWAYFGCHPNSNTGLTPYQAEQAFHRLDLAVPPVDGRTLRITGYGVQEGDFMPEWSQVQKTHTGQLVGRTSRKLEYTPDTTGGNSGSAVEDETTGLVVAIHTNGGCSQFGGSNSGSRLDDLNFRQALRSPRGVCAPFSLQADVLTQGQNTTFSVSGAPADTMITFFYSQRAGLSLNESIGVTLRLANPMSIGQAMSDLNGDATLVALVPDGTAGANIVLQAAGRGRASVPVNASIQP